MAQAVPISLSGQMYIALAYGGHGGIFPSLSLAGRSRNVFGLLFMTGIRYLSKCNPIDE